MSAKATVLDPLGLLASGAARSLAARPPRLAGLRIGVLDNSKPNADTLLVRVADLLVERAGAAGIRRFTKPGASRPCADLDAIVGEVDVVLTGSAD